MKKFPKWDVKVDDKNSFEFEIPEIVDDEYGDQACFNNNYFPIIKKKKYHDIFTLPEQVTLTNDIDLLNMTQACVDESDTDSIDTISINSNEFAIEIKNEYMKYQPVITPPLNLEKKTVHFFSNAATSSNPNLRKISTINLNKSDINSMDAVSLSSIEFAKEIKNEYMKYQSTTTPLNIARKTVDYFSNIATTSSNSNLRKTIAANEFSEPKATDSKDIICNGNGKKMPLVESQINTNPPSFNINAIAALTCTSQSDATVKLQEIICSVLAKKQHKDLADKNSKDDIPEIHEHGNDATEQKSEEKPKQVQIPLDAETLRLLANCIPNSQNEVISENQLHNKADTLNVHEKVKKLLKDVIITLPFNNVQFNNDGTFNMKKISNFTGKLISGLSNFIIIQL